MSGGTVKPTERNKGHSRGPQQGARAVGGDEKMTWKSIGELARKEVDRVTKKKGQDAGSCYQRRSSKPV